MPHFRGPRPTRAIACGGVAVFALAFVLACAPLARANAVELSPAATATPPLPLFEPEADWKQIMPGQEVPGVRAGRARSELRDTWRLGRAPLAHYIARCAGLPATPTSITQAPTHYRAWNTDLTWSTGRSGRG